MKPFFSLLTLVIFLTACTKKTKETIVDPPAEGAFTRTIVYSNQNNSTLKSSYAGNVVVETRARLQDNLLHLSVFATPKVPGTTGDGVAFAIDKSFLQQGLVGNYNLDAQTAPAVASARYNHMWLKEAGGFWSSIHETNMGLQMEGIFNISSYNRERQLVSGYFNLVIKDLISDPMRYDGPSTIDPQKLSTVTVTGTFDHVKIETD